jgi:hypothetical protein
MAIGNNLLFLLFEASLARENGTGFAVPAFIASRQFYGFRCKDIFNNGFKCKDIVSSLLCLYTFRQGRTFGKPKLLFVLYSYSGD